jgi:hypothetical protein
VASYACACAPCQAPSASCGIAAPYVVSGEELLKVVRFTCRTTAHVKISTAHAVYRCMLLCVWFAMSCLLPHMASPIYPVKHLCMTYCLQLCLYCLQAVHCTVMRSSAACLAQLRLADEHVCLHGCPLRPASYFTIWTGGASTRGLPSAGHACKLALRLERSSSASVEC